MNDLVYPPEKLAKKLLKIHKLLTFSFLVFSLCHLIRLAPFVQICALKQQTRDDRKLLCLLRITELGVSP